MFNSETITYDESGNPTSYLGANLTWKNGRQLASYTKGNLTVTYKYNADGLRTEKNVTKDGVVTNYKYTWSGDKLVHQVCGNEILHFYYDNNDEITGFSRDDGTNVAYYSYVKNIQGDIKEVIDSNGNTVATYSYDAWGNVTSSTGSLANINPIRYRGYYYDSEISMYYLQSRYYNPRTARFLNADDTSLIEMLSQQSIIGSNLFAYCENEPINHLDLIGCWAISMSNLAYLLDLGLFAVSFTAWGLALKIVIITVYLVRIGIAVYQLYQSNKKYKKGTRNWAYAVFDSSYNILISIMGIGATILGIPKISLRLGTLITAIKGICTVFGISLSASGLILSWANSLPKRKLSFKR